MAGGWWLVACAPGAAAHWCCLPAFFASTCLHPYKPHLLLDVVHNCAPDTPLDPPLCAPDTPLKCICAPLPYDLPYDLPPVLPYILYVLYVYVLPNILYILYVPDY